MAVDRLNSLREFSSSQSNLIYLVCTIGVGFAAMVAQLCFMREVLWVCAGNELTFGILLGEWLTLTGLGAWLARLIKSPKSNHNLFSNTLIILGVLPILSIVGLRLFKGIVLLPGQVPNLAQSVLIILCVAAPFCIISGFLVAFICKLIPYHNTGPMANDGQTLREQRSNIIGLIYAADSTGGVLGGLVFSLVLTWYFNHITISIITCMLNSILAFLFIQKTSNNFPGKVLCGAVIVICSLILFINLDLLTSKNLVINQDIRLIKSSPYGNVIVTASKSETNIYENGTITSSSLWFARYEECVHFVMAQRPSAANILILGGSFSGIANELLKYNISKITYMNPDPVVLNIQRGLTKDNPSLTNVEFVIADVRSYINYATNKFDIILINLPEPSTALANRYYTIEFLKGSGKVLQTNGVLSFSLGGYENYASPDLAAILSCARATANAVFKHVIVLPGTRVIFLCSNAELSKDIVSLIDFNKLKTKVLNRAYLQAIHSPDRLAEVSRLSSEQTRLNSDMNPILYFWSVKRWLKMFESGLTPLMIFCAGIILTGLLFYKGVKKLVFSAGYTVMSTQIAVFLVYQSIFGSLYSEIGLLTSVFLAGLAIGSWFGTEIHTSKKTVLLLALIFGLLICSIPMLLTISTNILSSNLLLSKLLIFLIISSTSVFAGLIIPITASALNSEIIEAAGDIYSSDLAGAACGAITSSLFTIPITGIAFSFYFSGLLMIIAIILTIITTKN